jgi:hypothetical protein
MTNTANTVNRSKIAEEMGIRAFGEAIKTFSLALRELEREAKRFELAETTHEKREVLNRTL